MSQKTIKRRIFLQFSLALILDMSETKTVQIIGFLTAFFKATKVFKRLTMNPIMIKATLLFMIGVDMSDVIVHPVLFCN